MTEPSAKFTQFVQDFTHLVDAARQDEPKLLARGRELLARLVGSDDWLPAKYAQPHPQYYQQYLLYADPDDRFSVVSFVWGPGQKTPIHNHTVWALIGMLRGSERAENFALSATGEPMQQLNTELLHPGDVGMVSPTLGDVHRVSNAYEDRVSISVHVYGGNIGRISRHVYDQASGATKPFVSGYSNQAELDRDASDRAPAIQDAYPSAFAHCFGCGPLNPQGHHLKSRLVGDETVALFQAPAKYTGGFPGKAYGGLVASLLDCHGTASAAAFAARAEGIAVGAGKPISRFVTASLKVDFKNPTPLETELTIRGRLRSLEGRKAWIDLSLFAGETVCATGEMLAIRLSDDA